MNCRSKLLPAIFAMFLSMISQAEDNPGDRADEATLETMELLTAEEMHHAVQRFNELIKRSGSDYGTGGRVRESSSVATLQLAKSTLDMEKGEDTQPNEVDLWLWVGGRWIYRDDTNYQSIQIVPHVWVTNGPDANGERVEVNRLEASFRSACEHRFDGKDDVGDFGFSYYKHHKGLTGVGGSVCMPGEVCFGGCAIISDEKWCSSTCK